MSADLVWEIGKYVTVGMFVFFILWVIGGVIHAIFFHVEDGWRGTNFDDVHSNDSLRGRRRPDDNEF